MGFEPLDERRFQQEVEAFLTGHASPDVVDTHPEQLPQTVDSPAKRAFMPKLAERGWLGMSWPGITNVGANATAHPDIDDDIAGLCSEDTPETWSMNSARTRDPRVSNVTLYLLNYRCPKALRRSRFSDEDRARQGRKLNAIPSSER
jgi:hypothetical protein